MAKRGNSSEASALGQIWPNVERIYYASTGRTKKPVRVARNGNGAFVDRSTLYSPNSSYLDSLSVAEAARFFSYVERKDAQVVGALEWAAPYNKGQIYAGRIVALHIEGADAYILYRVSTFTHHQASARIWVKWNAARLAEGKVVTEPPKTPTRRREVRKDHQDQLKQVSVVARKGVTKPPKSAKPRDLPGLERLGPTDKEAARKIRLAQRRFRNKLTRLWQGCSVTGYFDQEALLTASHIKPWSKSSDPEKEDKHNGLLLTPGLDALFDRGFITFDERGKVVISQDIEEKEYRLFGISKSMRLRKLLPEQQKYLEYHRGKIYENWKS